MERNRITFDYVKKYIENRGYKLHSTEYIRAKDYLKVECPNGHRYPVTWDAFKDGQRQKGRRCAKCSKRKVDFEEVYFYTESIGYKLVSTEYRNAKSKLKFKCPKGHDFPMSWSNFKNNKRRCPECQNLKRWTYNEVKSFFESRSYQLLTVTYNNTNQILWYICPKGHKSKTTFNKFKNSEMVVITVVVQED